MKIKGYALCSNKRIKRIFFDSGNAYRTKKEAEQDFNQGSKGITYLKEVILIIKKIKRLK